MVMADQETTLSGWTMPATVRWRSPNTPVTMDREYVLSAFIPDRLPPKIDWRDLIAETATACNGAIAAINRLDGHASVLPNPELLWAPLLLREARLSSKIENTVATTEEVALFAAGQTQQRSQVREVHNYLRAMEEGIAAGGPLTLELLRLLHRTLMSGTEGETKSPGEFRTGQVFLGDEEIGPSRARFVPPPGHMVAECMRELEIYLNPPHFKGAPDSRLELHPIIRAALVHYQFETIHPFRDGNGRLGRLLIALQLLADGVIERPLVYVSGFFEQRRSQYYDALLAVSTQGAWIDWVRLFCRAVESQSVDALERARALIALKQSMCTRVAGTSRAHIREIIDFLFKHPVVSASMVAQRLGIEQRTAMRSLNDLMDHGIVHTASRATKPVYFVAHEILATTRDGPLSAIGAAGGEAAAPEPPHPPT